MPKFLEVKSTVGNRIVVNVEHIIAVFEHSNGACGIMVRDKGSLGELSDTYASVANKLERLP